MSVQFVAARTLFSSERFQLMEECFATPDGEVLRPVIHHPGAVAILAQPDPASVVLVRQFRYALRRWTLEVPAGTRVPGEAAATTAARELHEEAGYRAGRLVEIGRFHPAPGVSDEELILFRAEGLTPVAAAPEHGELVGREVVALADLAQRLRAAGTADAKTVLALAMLGVPVADLLHPVSAP